MKEKITALIPGTPIIQNPFSPFALPKAYVWEILAATPPFVCVRLNSSLRAHSLSLATQRWAGVFSAAFSRTTEACDALFLFLPMSFHDHMLPSVVWGRIFLYCVLLFLIMKLFWPQHPMMSNYGKKGREGYPQFQSPIMLESSLLFFPACIYIIAEGHILRSILSGLFLSPKRQNLEVTPI